MKNNFVYYNSNQFGTIEDDGKITIYTEKELKDKCDKLAKEIGKKDRNRSVFSIALGVFCLAIAITLCVLSVTKVIDISIFEYTLVLAGCVLLWVILYFIFGLIFYKKEYIEFHFKNFRSNNPLSCLRYQSSDYARYVEKYQALIGNMPLYEDAGFKKLIVFAMNSKDKFKNKLIFNGKIKANVPYYYLSWQNKRMLFFPGIIILIDKANTRVFKASELTCIKEDNYKIKRNDETLLEFYATSDFNINFFNFKY